MRVLSVYVFIQGTACLFHTQAKYLHPCRPRHDDAHGRSLQKGAPTVGALSDAAMDENGRAMNRHLQVSWVFRIK